MTLTTAQAIQGLYSDYADLTDTDITLQKAIVAGDLETLNGGRFTGDDLTILEACLILDVWINRPGTGPVTEEKIFETSYKTKVQSSSYFMDKALKKIQDYDEKVNAGYFEVATRADSEMTELSEHEFEEYYEEV
jgi:hypothetical protein